MLVFLIHSGQSISYYAGSSWSKADMPTQQAWNQYLSETAHQAQASLRVATPAKGN